MNTMQGAGKILSLHQWQQSVCCTCRDNSEKLKGVSGSYQECWEKQEADPIWDKGKITVGAEKNTQKVKTQQNSW